MLNVNLPGFKATSEHSNLIAYKGYGNGGPSRAMEHSHQPAMADML